MRQANILLTGGHAATTALSVVEALNDDKSISWNISWVGPNKALEGSANKPFELELFPKLGVSVYSIIAGKLQSKFTRHTIPSLLKLPLGFAEAFFLIQKIKPQVVLSFGGFAAFPVVFAAWVLHKPVVVQEQIVGAGLANKMSAVFAKKIAIARSESEQFFPKEKCVLVGNPLTKEILAVRRKNTLPKLPFIYVTGGSRGAQRINNVVFAALPELLKKYNVIHHTGQLDFEKAKNVRAALKEMKGSYEVFSFISPIEIGKIYGRASILIGRAGANTVSEAMAVNIPSIFIPIPWSRGDEQTKNARIAEELGLALILPESKLTAESLVNSVRTLTLNWKKMVEKGEKHPQIDRNASGLVVSLVTGLL